MKYKTITKEEAFYLSIALWSYLHQFPNIESKNKLPKQLWDELKNLYFNCPCCAVYYDKINKTCIGCPLENNCIRSKGSNNYFNKWANADNDSIRKRYAKKILDKILESKEKINA